MLNTSTVKINTILNLFFLTTMVFFNFALGQKKAEHNKEAKFVNRLEIESSPYLLQHKNIYNPNILSFNFYIFMYVLAICLHL